MKIRAQIGMVLNLDKCIGCHTCSVTCKNVWTSREGVEYAWFNNVETKPGIGFPKNWEDQEHWKGGWIRKANGKLEPKMGSKIHILAKIFANPHLPEIDDYYEPFTFDYSHLQNAPESKAMPTARPQICAVTLAPASRAAWTPPISRRHRSGSEYRSVIRNQSGRPVSWPTCLIHSNSADSSSKSFNMP